MKYFKDKQILKPLKISLIVFLLFFSGLSLFFLREISFHPRGISLVDDRGEIKNIKELPFLEEAKKSDGEYFFKWESRFSAVKPSLMRIVPDNCLENILINGSRVKINADERNTCNYREGLIVNVGKYVESGQNYFEIKIKDHGGKYGLSVGNTLKDPLYFFLFVFSMPILLLPFFLILKCMMPAKSGKEKILLVVIMAAVAIRIFYLSYTDYSLRSHDVDGHIDYINYIAQNYSLPKSEQCWQCYQPPVYYYLTAIVSKISSFANLNFHFILQVFSLFLSFLFIVFGAKTIKKAISDENLQITAVSMMTFFSSGIIHSTRIGNDSLFYAFYSIGFYFLVKWHIDERRKDFYLAILFSALTTFAKLNGLILIIILAVSLFYKFLKKENRMSIFKDGLIFVFILMAVFSLSFYRPFLNVRSNNSDNLIVGNIKNLNGALAVKNGLKNYLWFDAATYLKEPFTYSWEDKGGRQYYWNFLVKTSLFGEFEYNNFKHAPTLAKYLSLILLPIFLLFIASLLLIFYRENLKNIKNCNFILFVSIIIPLISSIAMRIKTPFSPTGDFRYILPVIIPFSSLSVAGIKYFGLKNRIGIILKYSFYLLIFLMILLTISFFVAISGILD